MPKLIDLVGQSFDGMKVLAPTKRNSGRTQWLCKCPCGGLIVRRTSDLHGGRTVCKSSVHKGLVYRDGYAFAWKPEHPRSHRGRVREHILVVEELIGRYLVKGENVHHKNGVRDDNSPANLEIWASHQPQGQRPRDMIAHAFETLRRYLPLLEIKAYASQEKEVDSEGRYSDLPSPDSSVERR